MRLGNERVGFEKNCPSSAHEAGGNEMSEAVGEEAGEPEGGPGGGRRRTMTHSRDSIDKVHKGSSRKGIFGPPAGAARDGVVPPGSRLCCCRILHTWLLLGYCCGPVKPCLDQSAPIVAHSGPDVPGARDLPRTQSRRQSGRQAPPARHCAVSTPAGANARHAWEIR